MLPGMTNLTQRLRYYGLYCWLLNEYAKLELESEEKSLQHHYTFIRRAELIIAFLMLNEDPEVTSILGSDFAGRLFTYEWSEDFPVDGEYIFRGLCDNQAQLYFDNLKIADLASFADAVIPNQKTITKGLHNIRADLLNVPITETVTIQSPTPPSESIAIIDNPEELKCEAGYDQR